MKTPSRSTVSGWWLALAVSIVASLAMSAVLPGQLEAAPAAVDPGEVTLTPDDLPPGFTANPEFTRDDYTSGVGPSHQVQYEREPTAENLARGPIVVGQNVFRLDTGIGAGDALLSVKNFYIDQQGFVPSDAGPNDGGTFTLQKNDSGIDFIMIGFIKENMVFVTLAAGLPGVVSYQGVLELAGISSARLDEKLGR
jgi:hypothetical protein